MIMEIMAHPAHNFRGQQARTVRRPRARRPERSPAGAVSREEIASYAHYLWEQEGRPADRAEEHWLHAELQLRWARILNDLP
jgi:hypothetical protein